MKRWSIVLSLGVLCLGTVSPLTASALVRIERRTRQDRDVLLRQGVPLIKEFESFLLAWDAQEGLAERIEAMGFCAQEVDRPPGTAFYHLLASSGPERDARPMAGEIVWREENLLILRTPFPGAPVLSDRTHTRWQPLPLTPLRSSRPAAGPAAPRQEPDPRIQAALDGLTEDAVVGQWEALVAASVTRYSQSAGCAAAAQWAYAQMASHGLQVELQDYSRWFAPNVVATLPGRVHPEKMVVVLAHLDDMPGSGAAPGADDNASGSAMVLALAGALSRLPFENTLVFLLVTGEEQGLVGSTVYAHQAARNGDDILAALDADMIGWEGDGRPYPEDLDVNYDGNSEFLGTVMMEAGALYEGAAPVNAFFCPSMVYSDHAPFWDEGFPAVCGITDNEGFCRQPGTYPDYHTRNDTILNCGNPSFFTAAVRTFAAAAAELAVPTDRTPHSRPVSRP